MSPFNQHSPSLRALAQKPWSALLLLALATLTAPASAQTTALVASPATPLGNPIAVAIDKQGNVYIADRVPGTPLEENRYRIVKVSRSGGVTLVAGNGNGGYSGDNGPAIAASFNLIWDLAVDSSDNLYVTDQGRIRKITPQGTITTIAGTGPVGIDTRTNGLTDQLGDGGPATAAILDALTSVAVDASGNLYIAEYYRNRIRKVNTSGIISTVAGDGYRIPNQCCPGRSQGDGGLATQASINGPHDIALSPDGGFYFVEYYTNTIRFVDSKGLITTVAGSGQAGFSGDGGPARSARFTNPYALEVAANGTIYVADTGNGRIRKITPEGIISTVAGTGFGAVTAVAGQSPTVTNLGQIVRLTIGDDGTLYAAAFSLRAVFAFTFSTKPTVIIVPGILGTKLINRATNTTAWLSNRQINSSITTGTPGEAPLFRDLEYNSQGAPVAALETAEVLNLREFPFDQDRNNALTCEDNVARWEDYFTTDYCQRTFYAYNTLIDALKKAGYAVKTFPYDWRRDIRETSEDLYKAIKNAGGKVHVVAHSMGGLLLQDMLRRHEQEVSGILDATITLGTPYLGSVDAYLKIQGWADLIQPITAETTRNLARNIPTTYQLLPRWDFVSHFGVQVTAKDLYNGRFGRYPALPLAAALPTIAEPLWQESSTLTRARPRSYAIIGSGRATASGLITDESRVPECVDAVLSNGDGTVPLASAQGTRWSSAQLYVEEEHGWLPSNRLVQDDILRLLDGSIPPGLPSTPYPMKEILKLLTCSPVTPSLEQNGRTVAALRTYQKSDTGAHRLGESTVVWAPLNAVYTARFQGTDQGTANIYVERISPDGKVTSSTPFLNIPVTSRSQGSLPITNGTPGTFTYAVDGGATQIIGPATPILTAVANAASFSPGPVAPGEIITLFGTGLGPSNLTTLELVNGLVSTTLAGTTVTFDGISAPILYAQDKQTTVVVPYGLASRPTATMAVTFQGRTVQTVLRVAAAAPGIFMTSAGRAAALNQDGTVNSPANKARRGSVVSIYATGGGAITPSVADGSITAAPLSTLILTLVAGVNDAGVRVLYAGPAPGLVTGALQINLEIPANTPPGDAVPVTVGIQTPAGLAFSNIATISIE